MYAVIATGGKQYRVQVGDTLEVERLTAGQEATVELRPVMLVDDEGAVTTGRQGLSGAVVKATVLGQTRGPKLTVFKYKSKTGYRRKAGHRQPLTRIRVDEITA
ncbi:MAG: 50S ribosomal protein L21 [Actinomycetota bacterium]|nr:50S ribosomal protein L21 [Actinomycetota bacterium]